MLKKWLKKKLGVKQAEAGNEATVSSQPSPTRSPKSGNRPGNEQSSGKSKKKPKSPSRRSKYRNIEREDSVVSFSEPSTSTATRPIVDQTQPFLPTPPKIIDSSIPPPKPLPPSKKNKKSIGSFNIEKKKKKDGFEEASLIRIRPIQGPPERPATHRPPNSVERKEESNKPLSLLMPPSERLTHELSYLDVASPPSIDTALFAHEENGKNYDHMTPNDATDHHELDKGTPPTVIQAALPVRPVLPEEFDRTLSGDMGTSRPYRDDDFFTATRSQSGTGSKRLHMWMECVKQSIEAQRNKGTADNDSVIDRYYVEKVNEEDINGEEKKSEDKDDATDSSGDTSMRESKNMIEKSLREIIEQSKFHMTTTPKGILKSKHIEKGTIREDASELTNTSRYEYEQVAGESAVAGTATKPIKVFSKSRRQRLECDSTEEETSAASASEASSDDTEAVYETLRQLNPTVSMDGSQKSQGSMKFFYERLCDIGDMMEGYEDDLCHMDDEISIADDTIASRSTASKDSYLPHSGWLCFESL